MLEGLRRGEREPFFGMRMKKGEERSVQAEPLPLFACPIEAITHYCMTDAFRMGAVHSQLVCPACKGGEVDTSYQSLGRCFHLNFLP